MPSTLTRRKFLTGFTGAAALAAICPQQVIAQSHSVLEFRQGQALIPLHFNENALGMSEKAVSHAQQAVATMGHRYADSLVADLRSAVAGHCGVTTEQVVLGNGSTNVIGAFIHYVASKGATLIEPSPTFGDARRYAAMHNMPVKQVPVLGDFHTDLAAIQHQVNNINGPALVYLCNPNNPTGTILSAELLSKWIANSRKDTYFLIDEAYYEYALDNPAYASALSSISARPEQVLITRTFSKIYAMAGMRIGYGLAAPALASQLSRLASDFNLSVAGTAAALASIQDKAFYATSLRSNQAAKKILLNTLTDLGLVQVPSATNFVLHQIKGPVERYQARMLANGFKVGRRMTKADNWNRVSIGTPQQMTEFARTLVAFRDNGWI